MVFKQVGDEGLQAWVPFSKVIQEIKVLNVINFQKDLSLSTQILKNNF